MGDSGANEQGLGTPTIRSPPSRIGNGEVILHFAAEGIPTAEIAEKLFISPRTCETHRANLPVVSLG